MRIEIDFKPEPASRADVAHAFSEASGPIYTALLQGEQTGTCKVSYWRSDDSGLTDCEVKWGVVA